jgi:hypothetical protein
VARALELLYSSYSNCFAMSDGYQQAHPRLEVKLFKDRAEFRSVNRGLGWAEAYYREPYCRAYYSANEINPFHWMLHEAVHQLNHEVAHLRLEKWLEEGLAEYFSTSRLTANGLEPGRIDPNTYPLWWISDIASSPDLPENLRNGSVISLRAIITNHSGPSVSSHFNLYYLHWWTLTYFIFESAAYRERARVLLQQGGGLGAFEQTIGRVEVVQTEWHAYVRHLKTALDGSDLEFFRSRRISAHTNAPMQQ